MLSALKAGTDFPIDKLTNAKGTDTAVHKLSSGIYYIDEENTVVNDGTNKKKNGIAVAENATAYIYIPENYTLTVYGGEGTKADDAGFITPGSPVYTPDYIGSTAFTSSPLKTKACQSGEAGKGAEGGGAAIYVPKTATLVVLGKGSIHAEGGSGGKASQGAKGTNTTYWLFDFNAAEAVSGKAHKYTNGSSEWQKFEILYSYRGDESGGGIQSMVFQAGAGGTGGSGAGSGGAAIGANGATGAKGAKGAEPIMNDGAELVPLKRGGDATSMVSSPEAGMIAIENTITVTGTGGTGGDACTTLVDETWQNQPLVDTESIPNISDTLDKFTLPIKAHALYAASEWTDSERCVSMNVFFTNARKGGNGGAGGKGALIGAGGAGGAGGGGGDSASVVVPVTSAHTTYYTTDYKCGTDGATISPAAPSDTYQKFATTYTDNLPYNTITFAGVNDASPEKYYLQNSQDITVPDYTPANTSADTSTEFKGWKVTQAATKLPEAFGETVNANAQKLLTATEDAVYQYGNEISTAGFYGNVVLEPVLVQKVLAITKGDFVEKVTDASGNAINTASANQPVTVTAENREGYELTGFTVKSTDTTDPDINVNVSSGLSGTFNMPGYAVTVKANYKKKNYDVSVTGGKLTVTDENGTGAETTRTTAQVENTVAFTADDPIAGQYFDHWEFWTDSQQLNAADLDIQYGGKASDTQLTLKMPPKNLMLKAVFENIVTKAILFEDECGFARVDGKRVTAAQFGDTVTITAAAQDEMVFDYWEMFDANGKDITEKLADAASAETTFTMPSDEVTLKAHYKPIPADGGDTTTISAGGQAAIGAAAAVGVGVVVSEVAMHVYRNNVIQIGYWPGNRIQLAQLLWSRAGAPEPESDVPFVDIAEAFGTLTEDDATAQKAARWCVEQGLLDGKVSKYGTERFEPLDHVTHLRVCLTWQDARERGLFEVPAETE